MHDRASHETMRELGVRLEDVYGLEGGGVESAGGEQGLAAPVEVRGAGPVEATGVADGERVPARSRGRLDRVAVVLEPGVRRHAT